MILLDGLGSVRQPFAPRRCGASGRLTRLADEYGMIVQDYAYSPFGAPVQVMGGQVNPLQYTGEQWHQTTGLLYLRARWYVLHCAQDATQIQRWGAS